MIDWYIKCIKQYFDFTGRARRKEYWMFALANVIIALIIGVLELFIGDEREILSNLYSIFIFIPQISVAVRRLHDTGHNGWWYFILLIPIAGWIWFFILMVTDGDAEENRWGVSPKYGKEIDLNEFDQL